MLYKNEKVSSPAISNDTSEISPWLIGGLGVEVLGDLDDLDGLDGPAPVAVASSSLRTFHDPLVLDLPLDLLERLTTTKPSVSELELDMVSKVMFPGLRARMKWPN